MPRSQKAGSRKEAALSRWSRLKLESTGVATELEESAEQTAEGQESVTDETGKVEARRHGDEALFELPSIDELGPESDFQGFMDPRVDDTLRRAALKKLFSDPLFNVTDGLDVYAEDYTKLESMTPAMVAGLKHARGVLFGDVDSDGQTGSTQAARDLAGTAVDDATQETTLAAHVENPQRESFDPGSHEENDGNSESGDAEDCEAKTGDAKTDGSAIQSSSELRTKV
jgi:hypothetical protein